MNDPPIPLFHQSRAGAGSGLVPILEPVLRFSTQIKLAPVPKKQVPSQLQLLGGPETRTGDVGFVRRLWAELPHQKQKFPPPFFSTVNQEDE